MFPTAAPLHADQAGKITLCASQQPLPATLEPPAPSCWPPPAPLRTLMWAQEPTQLSCKDKQSPQKLIMFDHAKIMLLGKAKEDWVKSHSPPLGLLLHWKAPGTAQVSYCRFQACSGAPGRDSPNLGCNQVPGLQEGLNCRSVDNKENN